MRARCLMCALALGVAAPLTAQERIVDRVSDSTAREAIRTTLAHAESQGVPTAPLLTKVREGLAKQAPALRIAHAVEQMGERLGVANDALAAVTSIDEVSAGAGALQAGVSATTLRELRVRWPRAALTVPLGVMTQMVASGVPVSRAVSQVRLLLERHATPAQLVAFTSAVQADVAAGIAPDVAIMLRASADVGVTTTGISTGIGNAPPAPARPRP